MQTGGTGKLPNFVGGTGKLGKPQNAKGAQAPQELAGKAKRAVAEWTGTPGKLGEPPQWLVDKLADTAQDFARAHDIDVDRSTIENEIKGRLRNFASDFSERNPSDQDLNDLAEKASSDFAALGKGNIKMMPVI